MLGVVQVKRVVWGLLGVGGVKPDVGGPRWLWEPPALPPLSPICVAKSGAGLVVLVLVVRAASKFPGGQSSALGLWGKGGVS